MRGFVLSWTQTDRYANGTIQSPDGDWHRVAGEAVEADSYGRKMLFPGENVNFETGFKETRAGKRYRCALNVKRSDKETSVPPDDYAEICKVSANEKFLVRQVGGLLLVEYAAQEWIKQGNIVWCRIAEETPNRTWRAWDICLVAESEQSYKAEAEATYGPLEFPSSEAR